MPLDIASFAIKWQQTELSEKSAYQQHFRDLCEALGVPHPTEEDVVGASYTFEKYVTKAGGGAGFADVWKRDAFAWEYKVPGGNLNAAYKQLNEYHEALDNPPLLIVCDFKRFEIHTKFESQPSRVYAFDLEDIRLNREVATSALLPRDVLEHVFGDRNKLRPTAVTERVTQDAAKDVLRLAQKLEIERAADDNPPTREQIAHFLIRLVFCLFADSIGLIPNHAFRSLVESSRKSAINFNRKLPQLFEAMSFPHGIFGVEDIPHFNGGLFTDNNIIDLNFADLAILRDAARRDWSQIEPAIFGTLFERSLDAAKRSMIGAHYTSPEDILLLIEPAIMTPLRRQWDGTRAAIEDALTIESGTVQRRNLRANRPANTLLNDWAAGLQRVRILDPACGSGNFLYMAMKRLLDLWHEVRMFALNHGLVLAIETMPTPAQLFGIEVDFYAHEIASVVVWIGLLQWKRDNGYNDQPSPILRKLSNIEHADAIMRYDTEGEPYEPEWPEAEYIVGNPPFLGGKFLRRGLGDRYVNELFDLYSGSVPAQADLVVYWFDRALRQLLEKRTDRVGLLATQSIRGGANRALLERIQENANIFYAWSDRNWVLAGAAVHISIIAFDRGDEKSLTLDGQRVDKINPDLTSGADVTAAQTLAENADICFMGVGKVGDFDLSGEVARKMLRSPINPNGRPNSDVVRPWMNALDITRRPRGMYIIDFGSDISEKDAALYEMPFQYLLHHVREYRLGARSGDATGVAWWRHQRSRPTMRNALSGKRRYIATPRVAKHRVFVFVGADVVPDNQLYVFAREDEYFLGVLQSRLHESWARAQGTQLREAESGFRYTPNSTFDTFPFPWPPGTEPSEADSPLVRTIADAAKELVRLRDNWLNPPGASEDDLRTHTLTHLYNARPQWLIDAHRALDEAVFAAYGWRPTLSEQEILAHLLALNRQRASSGNA